MLLQFRSWLFPLLQGETLDLIQADPKHVQKKQQCQVLEMQSLFDQEFYHLHIALQFEMPVSSC